jgi:endonuclease-3
MRLSLIEKKLEKAYGKRRWKPHGSAVEVLISTILSQNTSDTNSGRAFESLMHAFNGWDAVANARIGTITKSIKSGGLAKIKAKYIKEALCQIYDDFGRYDLSSLKKVPIDKSLQYLTALNGVGEKTAACVLLFAFCKKIMPVDTHVHRVTKRLGLVPKNADRQKSFQFWFGKKSIVDYYSFHLNLVRHGRITCLARKPMCGHCVLNKQCAYYREHFGDD